MPELFPVFLKLERRRVLLVGGGPVAAAKLPALVRAGADVLVVAPRVSAGIRRHGVTVAERAFRPSDLNDAWLVIAAATPAVNERVARAAGRQRLFVNAVDDPKRASAYLGAVVRRDDLTLAISTEGAAPALAALLRESLDSLLPPDLSRWRETAVQARERWKSNGVPMAARRPLLLHALNALYEFQRERPE